MKIPIRTCAVCRTKKLKKELFRFVVVEKQHSHVLENARMLSDVSGEVCFDKKQDMAGRGFYMCSGECWENARRKRRKVKYNSVAKPAKMVGIPDVTLEDMMAK